MTIPETRVRSVGELVASVVEITSSEWAPAWFRGQADASWGLDPKVVRNVRQLGVDESYETNLVHRYRGRAPLFGAAIDNRNRAAWLQTMQHHGLPTRLLDWSRSALVAAYFAVERAIVNPHVQHPDAAVWCLDPHGLNRWSTNKDIEFTPSIDSGTVRALIDGAFYGDKAVKMSAKYASYPELVAVMSNETDIRMLVQQGAFTIHRLTSASLESLTWAPRVLRKFVVPGPHLHSFAREVEASGFGEAGIYPDLDHLSSELERTQRMVGGASVRPSAL